MVIVANTAPQTMDLVLPPPSALRIDNGEYVLYVLKLIPVGSTSECLQMCHSIKENGWSSFIVGKDSYCAEPSSLAKL